MTCDEYRAHVLAGQLPEAAETHAATCAACRAEVPALVDMRRLLKEPLLWEEPEPELRERAVRAVESEARPHPRSRRARWLVPAAAAAVLLGALALIQVRAPAWEVSLRPIEAAPTSFATVSGWNTESGTRLEIEVGGIAPAPPGYFYEVWMTAQDGRHVSAGTFRGPGTVQAWSGVRRSEFPRIWITLEAADEDESPSGPMVFDI